MEQTFTHISVEKSIWFCLPSVSQEYWNKTALLSIYSVNSVVLILATWKGKVEGCLLPQQACSLGKLIPDSFYLKVIHTYTRKYRDTYMYSSILFNNLYVDSFYTVVISSNFIFIFLFFRERSHYVSQTGLNPLGSRALPASTSQVAEL